MPVASEMQCLLVLMKCATAENDKNSIQSEIKLSGYSRSMEQYEWNIFLLRELSQDVGC